MAKLILVGGGTASGKTYVINKVIESLGNEHITHISIDDYYKDLTHLTLEERKTERFCRSPFRKAETDRSEE